MYTVYKTRVVSLETVSSSDGLSDIVTAVNWQVLGTDGANTVEQVGTTNIGPPNPTLFIPYNQLSMDTVLGWISNPANDPIVQANIQTALDSKNTVDIKAPPWSMT